MRANLPQREPETLERWKKDDLYGRVMKRREKSRTSYILHDGPPYSNGDIHMGHALNKILKDIVVKFNAMNGSRAPFIPGWDCHGLPVEHQLMKKLKIDKGDIDQVEFRNKAADFALKYVGLQRSQFERLGVFGDWARPYLTLDPGYESAVVRSFAKLVGKGYIYKDLKPVNWCCKCETALAEAEVIYETRTSPSIYVKFKLKDKGALMKILDKDSAAAVKGDVYVLAWTTTPWTLIANVALALSPSMTYVVSRAGGEYFILAEDLLAAVESAGGLKDSKIIARVRGKKLEGLRCLHPFIDRDSVIVLADYVCRDEGTGCVHTAPGHGQEDHVTGKKYNLTTIMPVDSRGVFDKDAGEFKGTHVLKANEKIIARLKEKNALLSSGEIQHSYPHCWRCKNPIIFRATKQYFMKVDHLRLRSKVMRAVENDVRWMPAAGKGRISAMISGRPDWCLSRQRLWGVPIVAFYCARCGHLLLKEDVINYAADIFEKEGSGAWFARDASELISPGTKCEKCGHTSFRKESDILDVWFESGVSHQAVLKARGEFPSDLYLEGSDQHRGWFQSAMLSSMAIEGCAPYRAVLTHGFVVDGEGKKMSKSIGNVMSPLEVMKKYGADILRIWAASCDYRDDVRISSEILARLAEAYRKIRNTCRYILSNLGDFDPAKDIVPEDKWSDIDRWALWRARLLLEAAEKNFRDFNFHKVFGSIYNFCVVDMSSIYLDVLKDVLYTAGKNSVARRAAQSALFEIIVLSAKVMSPILAYTAEEVWRSLPHAVGRESVHLEDWPDLKALEAKIARVFSERDAARWSDRLLPLRDAVLKELEKARGRGTIGSPLEAKVILYTENEGWREALRERRNILGPLFIVSAVEVSDSPRKGTCRADNIPIDVGIARAEGKKCLRCWNYSASVGANSAHPDICVKCAEALSRNSG